MSLRNCAVWSRTLLPLTESLNNVERIDLYVERIDSHVERIYLHVERIDLHVERIDLHVERIDLHVERVDLHVARIDLHVYINPVLDCTATLGYLDLKKKLLTHLCRADSFTLTPWTSSFPVLGLSG